jgi:hypothetical protein
MMRLIFTLIIVCLVTLFQGYSQTLASNYCDSSVLTQQEYEKCKGDTIYNNDLVIRVNYITFLKTKLLPKYRVRRKALNLSEDIIKDVKLLKTIYDSTVSVKFQRMQLDMDRNQKYVQPKAYMSSLLAFETFKFYPDVYAILFNEIHLSLNPKTNYDEMKQIQKLVYKIYTSLSNPTKDKIYQITSELTKEKKAFIRDYSFFELFQGEIAEEKQKTYNIINFLLWTE